jgi:hypothetical protein
LSQDEEEDNAAREAPHLAMARRNSVATDVCEKAKCARDADVEEARDIHSDMACHGGYVLVDTSRTSPTRTPSMTTLTLRAPPADAKEDPQVPVMYMNPMLAY